MKSLLAVSLLLFLFGCGREKRAETALPPAESVPPQPHAEVQCVPAQSRLCPVDEAAADSSFLAFRREMLNVVDRKDAQGLSGMIDPAIRWSFGDDGGVKAFFENWQPQSPSSSLWSELHEVLANGGSFREIEGRRMFWAPYVFSTWPDSIDAYEHAATIRAKTPLRSSPSDSGGAIAALDWAIVELIFGGPADSAWTHVRAADGKEGWIREVDLRRPLDYRVGFDRIDGSWKMTVLVAGD